MSPVDFPCQHNGERFQVRKLGDEWQVYGHGVSHVCMCTTDEMATMIAQELNVVGDRCTCSMIDGIRVIGSSCVVHGLSQSDW